MKYSLLIVGSNSAEALESSYERAFRRLGWLVRFWNPMSARYTVARGGTIGRIFSTFVHVEPWVRTANQELLWLVSQLQPNLMLVIGTTGVRYGTLAQIRVIAPGMPIYCIYPDSPHNLDADRINCLPAFDRVTTSSPAWVSAFEQLGARQVHYFPFAADTDFHYPVARRPGTTPRAHAVTFVGTWRLERELVLEQLIDFDLGIWGTAYWKHRTRSGSPLHARWGNRVLIGEEFAQACAESAIMLNVLDLVTQPGPNMRTFEQPACRAFSLVTRTDPVLDLFTEGINIVCFESVPELREKIHYYLAHESERQRIADASYEFVVNQGHTYVDRAQQIIAWAREDGYTVR